MANEIYSLKLHEATIIKVTTNNVFLKYRVTRVHAGWLYVLLNGDTPKGEHIFVPYTRFANDEIDNDGQLGNRENPDNYSAGKSTEDVAQSSAFSDLLSEVEKMDVNQRSEMLKELQKRGIL